MSIALSPARAAASRRNGARSHGPRSAAGMARASQNALEHGLCAQKHVLLADEDARPCAALEAALTAELAPDDAMQTLLVGRIVRAAWRLERAERLAAATGLGPRSPTRRPTGRAVRVPPRHRR